MFHFLWVPSVCYNMCDSGWGFWPLTALSPTSGTSLKAAAADYDTDKALPYSGRKMPSTTFGVHQTLWLKIRKLRKPLGKCWVTKRIIQDHAASCFSPELLQAADAPWQNTDIWHEHKLYKNCNSEKREGFYHLTWEKDGERLANRHHVSVLSLSNHSDCSQN